MTIAFVVFDDFQSLDLSGPLAVFELANELSGAPVYKLQIVSRAGGPVRSSAGLEVMSEAAPETSFDTVVVVGGNGAQAAADDEAHRAMVRALAGRSRRMSSVCTGAFLLAGVGLLNGRRAATHWRYARQLQRAHPMVRVEPDHIFIGDGPVWSAAGVTAGIDLALALVEDDLGAAVARGVARELVVYYRRPGGQTQFSALLELEPASDRIRRVLTYAREHLTECLSVSRLAEIACLSERQFGRAFYDETGETPARAIERLRVEAARVRLEGSMAKIEEISIAVGFSDPERMRRAFLRRYGQPPQAIRRVHERNL